MKALNEFKKGIKNFYLEICLVFFQNRIKEKCLLTPTKLI